mmetsp:Transcript_43683/g.105915  ORF Transcript_43683/g.105915 Transcript_43683/m.105915 type:complete len:894 (+) Transcript_43683:299-2980(+)
MGGGISRLESTDWETADGKLDGDSIQQTIDGTLPIGPKFGLYEIQKKTVGQREFDLVNKELELVYTTKSVPGTVSWFDVLGPGSCGDYVDSKLRVTSDIARRTWIVYRYYLPLFEGQKPCSDPAVVKGLQEGVLLYRTACITVSWSRYIAVAARYGPPDLSDFLDVAVESADQTTNNTNGDDDSVVDDSDAIQSPHELQQQHQKQQNEQTPPLQKEESFGDDPLFTQAQQIAERHRDHSEESPATETGTTTSSVVEEDGTSRNEKEDVVTNTAGDTNIEEDKACVQVGNQDGDCGGGGDKAEVEENVDEKSDDQQTSNNSTPSTDDDASNNNKTTNDDTDTTQIQASRSSVSRDPNDKSPTAPQLLTTQQMRTSQSFGNSSRSSRMLPATTLTTSVKAAAAAAAAASASKTGSLSSSMMSGGGNSRRRLRDYFSSSKSSSLSLGATASGSQDSDDIPEEDEREDEAERLKREAMELNLLYELALEGVIDLDTQPIMQCQEVYNKMIGNHQTFLMTKDEVIELLRMDEQQHEEQLEQQHATGETTNEDSIDTGINPMLQAVELDAKHKEQDSQQTTLSGSPPRSRWMSRWSSIRSSAASGAAASTGAVEVPSDTSSKPIEKFTEDASTADKPSSDSQTQQSGGGFGSGRRLRSSWNRMLSSTTAITATAETTTIAEGSNEESTQSFEVPKEPPTAQPIAVLNRETLPSLMDESASSSNIDDTSNAMTSEAEDDESEKVIETSRNTTDAVEGEEYPGSGVEESKEERSEATDDQNFTPTYDEKSSAEKSGTEGQEMPKDESTQPQETEQEAEGKDEPPPPPLTGYFSWKHTTMNFAQHKMVLHLAKNSDLALHLVLSIIVNQVRSERNHTVFFTTGIHPTWVYPSSWKNPKEMIS